MKIGGDVVVIKLNGDGTFRSMEPFITGFIQNNNYVGRPVDVLPMKDGSMLVSDDLQRRRLSRQPRGAGVAAEMTTAARGRQAPGPSACVRNHRMKATMRGSLVAMMLLCATTRCAAADSFEERMAPCLACHGEKGQSTNPEIPSLGAQTAPYVLIQLSCFARSCAASTS